MGSFPETSTGFMEYMSEIGPDREQHRKPM